MLQLLQAEARDSSFIYFGTAVMSLLFWGAKCT